MKKVALCALTILVTSAFIACGDDSSSSGSNDAVSCKFTLADDSLSFKMELKYDGITDIREGKINKDATEMVETQTYNGASGELIKNACEDETADSKGVKNVTVECKDNKIITKTKLEPVMGSVEFLLTMGIYGAACKLVDSLQIKPSDPKFDELFADDADDDADADADEDAGDAE